MRLPCRPFAARLIPIFLLLSLFCLCGLGQAPPAAAEQVREPLLAGTWYPAHPDQLRDQIHSFLDKVGPLPSSGTLLGLIAPHAGYVYSGQVAAHAYKLLIPGKYETVIVIAPSHRVRFKGISVFDRGGYRTPLGTVPLDRELIADIQRRDPAIRLVSEAHAREHSLEIQLPFLQIAAPGIRLVPLVMGSQDLSTCQSLARTLAEAIKAKPALLVASTDLSHFHPYEKARALDAKVIRHVQRLDAAGLARDLAAGACEACGGGPLVTTLLAAGLLGADRSDILNAANSGDVSQDRSRVVGYMAASLWATGRPPIDKNRQVSKASLSGSDQALLLRIARASVEAHLSGREMQLPPDLPDHLRRNQGAFVTLRKNGRLRGCIGHIVGRLPLAQTVARMAVAAAVEDPRFPPVRREELPALEYEISVMSPLEALDDIERIQVGTHGIYLQRGASSGLLLPQVATEYGWDRRAFLEQTCLKARLPKNAWQDPATRVFIFSAQVF